MSLEGKRTSCLDLRFRANLISLLTLRVIFPPPDRRCDKVKHNAAQFTLDRVINATLARSRSASPATRCKQTDRQTDRQTRKQTNRHFPLLCSPCMHRSSFLSPLLGMKQKKCCCCCCCCTSHTTPETAAWSVAHLRNNNHAV